MSLSKKIKHTVKYLPFALSLIVAAPFASAADGSWTFPFCGAPNSAQPGYVPHGDPQANGSATVVSVNGLISVDIQMGNQRYDAHHAHLYSATNGYDNADKGHSTVCWAYDNLTVNDPSTAPFNEKALHIEDWPYPGSYSENWYKGYINQIPADGGDWFLMVHMLGGHFALDDEGHLIEWDSSAHEVNGDDDIAGNYGGSNNVKTSCNARVGRTLADTSVKTGICISENGSFNNADEPYLDQNGHAWLNGNGSLSADAIEHGYDLNTEYLFFSFADEGVNGQWGGPEGGAGGWLNTSYQDGRCLSWPAEGWGDIHSHGPPPPDELPPVLTLVGASTIALELDETYVEQGATANDARDGDISASVQITGSVDTNTPGTYTISYNVADAAGNQAAPVSRTVTVSEYVDRIAPVLTLIGGDVTIDFNGEYIEQGATALDNDDGNLTTSIQISGTVDSSVSADYIISYSVSDAAGNTASATRTVTVDLDPDAVDLTLTTSKPVYVPGESIVFHYTNGSGSNKDWIGVYTAGNLPADCASSNAYLAWAYTNGGEGSSTFSSMVEGDYIAQLYSNDGWCKIGDSVNFSVQDADVTAPVITLNGSASVTLDLNQAYVEAGATASDNVDGDVSANIQISGSVDSSTIGTYTLTYSVSDAAGNSATATRTVTVLDDVEVDTLIFGTVKYNRANGKLTVVCRSSDDVDGIVLTLEGYGVMPIHPNKADRFRLVISMAEVEVPATVTVTSSNGGTSTKTVGFKN